MEFKRKRLYELICQLPDDVLDCEIEQLEVVLQYFAGGTHGGTQEEMGCKHGTCNPPIYLGAEDGTRTRALSLGSISNTSEPTEK